MNLKRFSKIHVHTKERFIGIIEHRRISIAYFDNKWDCSVMRCSDNVTFIDTLLKADNIEDAIEQCIKLACIYRQTIKEIAEEREAQTDELHPKVIIVDYPSKI